MQNSLLKIKNRGDIIVGNLCTKYTEVCVIEKHLDTLMGKLFH